MIWNPSRFRNYVHTTIRAALAQRLAAIFHVLLRAATPVVARVTFRVLEDTNSHNT